MLEVASPEVRFTPRQSAAVTHRGGNLLVEAVPGSGKTQVIVARCEALIGQGVPATSILLLTFSRRAVSEIRDRLGGVLAPDGLPDIHTFHGFAARLLAEAGNAGHSRRLLSEPAERMLFERSVQATRLPSLPAGIGDSAQFRDAASACVDDIRRSSASARALLAGGASPRIADLLALESTQRGLRDRVGVADFDDLVARCVTLASMPSHPVARTLAQRYAHVLVDEFQDSDALMLALLAHLNAEIFAVGDAAQAIYGFRGAARDALHRAQQALAMTTLPLDESFRCPAPICELACSVWPERPTLTSRVTEPGAIEFRHAVAPADEAGLIADTIEAAIAAGTPEREIAVLVRRAEPLATLADRELRRRGIATARQGGENVLDNLAVDALRAALEAFGAPHESQRWEALLAHPVFELAALPLRLALAAAPPVSVAHVCELVQPLTGRVSGAQIATALRAAQAPWDANDPVAAARAFASAADILGFVVAQNEADAQHSSSRIATFLDALTDVRDLHRQLGLASSSTTILTAFLTGAQSWRGDTASIVDEAGVRILTVHAAKGLEFEFVAIADAADDRFPQRRRADMLLSDDDIDSARTCGVDLGTRESEHLAEERSLWYVAVTRAKRRLLVTWSDVDAEGAPQRPSRFIPLARRMQAAREPSYVGSLNYAGAAIAAPQIATAARLVRALPASGLETWFTCRRKFYYASLLRIGSDERGFKPKLGTLVHRTIEEFHRTARDFRVVPAGAAEQWTQQLDAIAHAITSDAGAFEPFDSVLETLAALRAAHRLLNRYARSLVTTATAQSGGFEIVAIEKRVEFVVSGASFAGKIDRIDRRADGSTVLVDVKTGAFKSDKAMLRAFGALHDAASNGTVWTKEPIRANPQLALYRHAEPAAGQLRYLYLDARPKAAEFKDAAQSDELEVRTAATALAALDGVLATTFFEPWANGTVTALEPTRNARTCRSCEFIRVCPGYLEDDEG